MDDKILPTTDTNTLPDLPTVEGGDTPPLPPLSPEAVKTPTQPLPKPSTPETSSEEVVKAEKDTTIPVELQNSDTATPTKSEESDAATPVTTAANDIATPTKPEDGDIAAPILPDSDTVMPPAPSSDEVVKPLIPPVETKEDDVGETISPPEKEELPVEAEFPGQPIPASDQENLEEKAKEMIDKDGGVKDRKVSVVGKPKGNTAKTLMGVLLMVLVGGGVFAGTRLVDTSTENRSSAAGSAGDGIAVCNQCDWEALTSGCNGTVVCYMVDDNDTPSDTSDDETVNCGNRVCDGWARIKCCDGNWEIDTIGDSDHYDAVCAGHGGQHSCGTQESNDDNTSTDDDKCSCESWDNACGTNCTFPSNTTSGGQARANETCKAQLAICHIQSGSVSFEDLATSDCKDEVDVCKNPVFYPNCQPDPKQCNESCIEGECGGNYKCDLATNTCRNPSCSSSVNCTCPDGDLVCNSLTSSTANLKLGESYTFTCDAVATGEKSIARYQFRYQRNVDGWQNLSSSDLGISESLLISGPGGYVVQCRVCEDTDDEALCTPYQVVGSN